MASSHVVEAVIDTQNGDHPFQKELESAEEKNKLASWLCLNLNWTIISMWLPAGALTNPEDAASASLPGLCYLKCGGLEVKTSIITIC